MGLACPGDVSVAAIDDFPWADVFEPKLTAVAQPVEAFGAEAARMLVERMQGAVQGRGRTIVLRGTLNAADLDAGPGPSLAAVAPWFRDDLTKRLCVSSGRTPCTLSE